MTIKNKTAVKEGKKLVFLIDQITTEGYLDYAA